MRVSVEEAKSLIKEIISFYKSSEQYGKKILLKLNPSTFISLENTKYEELGMIGIEYKEGEYDEEYWDELDSIFYEYYKLYINTDFIKNSLDNIDYDFSELDNLNCDIILLNEGKYWKDDIEKNKEVNFYNFFICKSCKVNYYIKNAHFIEYNLGSINEKFNETYYLNCSISIFNHITLSSNDLYNLHRSNICVKTITLTIDEDVTNLRYLISRLEILLKESDVSIKKIVLNPCSSAFSTENKDNLIYFFDNYSKLNLKQSYNIEIDIKYDMMISNYNFRKKYKMFILFIIEVAQNYGNIYNIELVKEKLMRLEEECKNNNYKWI